MDVADFRYYLILLVIRVIVCFIGLFSLFLFIVVFMVVLVGNGMSLLIYCLRLVQCHILSILE